MRQLFADGILAREESLREGLIDDRDLGLRLVIGFLERAAPQQAGAERAEIGGADVPLRDVNMFAVPGTAKHSNPGGVAVAAQGHAVRRDSYRGDAGQVFRPSG